MADIDFWFSIGSTYTYLSVMRLSEVARRDGIRFRWRPFSVRSIMRQMNNVPFANKPVKMAYMWRDLARRAAMYGLPVRVPAPYPLKEFDLANRVAVLGTKEGWCEDYVRGTYRRWFQEGLEAGSEPNLSDTLLEIGLDPMRVTASAWGDDITQAYESATEEARRLEVFGVPTFIVNGERFWGDDRLDDALSWLRYGKVVSSARPQ